MAVFLCTLSYLRANHIPTTVNNKKMEKKRILETGTIKRFVKKGLLLYILFVFLGSSIFVVVNCCAI